MRKIDQKQRHGGGGGGGGGSGVRTGGNNGFIPTSIRSISSYLRIVSSGASTVASTVRSAASAASTIVDRDADAIPDQVLWAGFDKLECEAGISHRVLLLGYQFGFQVWDVEDANNVRNIVSRYDGAVSFMQILPKPIARNHSQLEESNGHPLLVLCADGSFSAGGNDQVGPTVSSNSNVNGGFVPTSVWFYSLKSHSYIKELKFRSVVYSVRCSSRIVAVLQAAQVHCFDAATLEREYTILTNPILATSPRFENIGLGPLAMGPRWIAYSGTIVALPNTSVSPQHLTHPGSNGNIVARYAKQSSKQLAVGIVTLGDIGYKKLSRNSNTRLPDTENVGMVIVRDVVSKSVIAQFRAHDSPIASLCFDPSGTLLVTASVHGHSFNVFRIMPGPTNSASYVHLYRLQRGFTNAVIQDISFSVDSCWITISSSRGTSHLFAISPSGGPVDFSSTSNQGCSYDAASKPPVTLSPVSRIRSGNIGFGRMSSSSGVIASTFHKCKGNDPNPDSNLALSNYHMLVFSSSGCVIQYALRLSSEVKTVYESMESSSPDTTNNSKLVVDPIQKWNICNKQNRRDREESIDIYGENGHVDNRKVFPERTENEKTSDFKDASKIKKDIVNLEEKNHVYISEVELQMHPQQMPIWAKGQICFQSLTITDVINGETNSNGEFEIEKISACTIEARSRNLVPAVITRVPNSNYNNNALHEHHEKLFPNGSSFKTDDGVERDGEDGAGQMLINNALHEHHEKLFPNGSSFKTDDGVERDGEDGAGQMLIKDTNGFVNKDGCSVSDTLPEAVDNREHSVDELVNNNIGQKLENHFEDQGAEFD